MTFIQVTAPTGAGKGARALPSSLPPRHIVIETLRAAARSLGLGPSVIATLDAMLSCLPPERHHHVVFASNKTLSGRLAGVSERTIRRHAAQLAKVGLLTRQDSANGKRFTRRDRQAGRILRFGFDLSPLYDRFPELAARAAARAEADAERAYLRTKLRALVTARLQRNPNDAEAEAAHRSLRRALTRAEIAAQIAALSDVLGDAPLAAEAQERETTTPQEHRISHEPAPNLTANDGHFDRHHQNSNPEHIDKHTQPELSVIQILQACPEAAQYAVEKIDFFQDVTRHAQRMAPMLGIDRHTYGAAEAQIGARKAALTLWAMMEFLDRIHSPGAYFRSLTTGARSATFDPEDLIRRLMMESGARSSAGTYAKAVP